MMQQEGVMDVLFAHKKAGDHSPAFLWVPFLFGGENLNVINIHGSGCNLCWI